MMDRIAEGGSWSGHERNCCFLNTGKLQFANVSGVSGLDYLDDGRCVAPVDWDHDGDLDLWLSARTGPALRFARNNGSPGQNFVAFRLEGTSCNRDGIGARVEIAVSEVRGDEAIRQPGEEKRIRTLHAGDGYLSQGSKWVHFGLGRNRITRVVVRWPGGELEEFSGVASNQQFVLRQGEAVARLWQPPERTVSLKSSPLDTLQAKRATRIVIRDRIPMVDLEYDDLMSQNSVSVREIESGRSHDGPVLINLWATWCRPCLAELSEFSRQASQLEAAGIDIVALNVESADEHGSEAIPKAREFLVGKLKFPFRSGLATPRLLEKLDALQEVLISLRPARGQLPSSFLVDRFGRLRMIYSGQVSAEQLIRDAELIDESGRSGSESLPFPGRWLNEPDESIHGLVELAREFDHRGLTDEAIRFGSLAADPGSRHGMAPEDRLMLAEMFFREGNQRLQKEQFRQAVPLYQKSVRLRPESAEAHSNLGTALRLLRRFPDARRHLEKAVALNPNLMPPHFGLGLLHLDQGQAREAIEHFRSAVSLQPQFAEGHHRLGVALVRTGQQQAGVREIQQALRLEPLNLEARESLSRALQGESP